MMTTPTTTAAERIAAVMALQGKDLAAEVLVQVLGWRWYARPVTFNPLSLFRATEERVALYPPEGSDWERFNFDPFDPAFVDVTGREKQYKPFSDWFTCCGKRYPGSSDIERFGIPRPDEDERDVALVRAELQRRGLMERFAKMMWATVPPRQSLENLAWSLTHISELDEGFYDFGDIAALLLASPADQCRAALLAVWGQEESKEGAVE